MEVFSARLKWLREKLGITQKEMAERLGVSQPYYGRFEKGTGQPNLESLIKLPSIFYESLDFICGVTSIDSNAYDLMYDYLQMRYRADDTEKRLQTTIELLETDRALNIESKVRLMTKERERLSSYRNEEEQRYDKLITYLNLIPIVDESLLNQETWDKEYDRYCLTVIDRRNGSD